jgi:lipopolysaccharide/colanic/teichoic acid biosynthesis glycosyltransferase
MLICAIAIKLDDGGPILFRQNRITKDGKIFNIYKFRSMIVDADKDGAKKAETDDDRITRVGKVIRMCRVDELPQLINVLKGDMTLVGPRPPLPREVQFYTDYQRLRLLVTPGITCTWQIHKNRNDVPFEEWVEMDIEYIQTRTYRNDLIIMLKTPIVMLTATGR